MLAKSGWALFLDCDILCRGSLARLFELVHWNTTKAVYCVKHNHVPKGQVVKMDGQAQTLYARKNWSSVMLFNCDHPSNKALTLEYLNTTPGRDLHRFAWLEDDEIGELSPIWNYLVGYTEIEDDPQLVHFTSGTPSMPGYEHCEYADEYKGVLRRWARQVA
jgi:lipopolysaccharide biosynthesis glycosyltransferase